MKVFKITFFYLLVMPALAFGAQDNTILEVETREVVEMFKDKTVKAIYNYCQEKAYAVTCGQLVTFNNTKSFVYNFASLERQVAATVYYLEKPNGRFKNVLDEIPDGKVGIDKAFPYNDDLEVIFDEDGLPTVKNVRVVKHGTSIYSISTLTITHNGLRYDSTVYDSQKPDWSKKSVNRYDRRGLPVFDPSKDLLVVKNIKKLFSKM